MSDEPKSLAGLLSDLDEVPVDPSESPEVSESAAPGDILSKARTLPLEDKKWQAFEWSMQGHAAQGIAKMFEVSTSTIYRWLQDLYTQHRQNMEQLPAADILSEHLLWLGRLEALCLHEVNLAKDEGATIDPTTGRVTKPDQSRTKSTKVKFIQAALKARQMKIEMLQKANVLPVEPEKIYHTMSEERRKVKDEEDDTKAIKSREEVERSIQKLIEKGLSL